MTESGDRVSRRDYLAGATTAGTAALAGCSGLFGGGGDALSVAYMPIYPDMQHFVMQEEGYYDEIPTTVETTEFPSGPRIVQAYASGDIDVALFGIVPAMIVIDRGIGAKVVAANIQEAMGIIVHEEFASMWDPDDPAGSFAQWEQEQGQPFRFGTFPEGSVPDILLRYWLSDVHGLDPEEAVEITGLNGASGVFNGLASGSVDGTSIMEPVPTRVTDNDLPYERIANAGAFMPGQPAAVTLVSDEVRDTDAAQAFVTQHQRATEFIADNRDTAAEHASTVIGAETLSPETAKRAMASPLANFISDPHEIEDGTKTFARYAEATGKTDSALTVDEIFDYSLYDDR